MRRVLSTVATLAVAFLAAPLPASSQTVDELVARNLQAKGGLDLLRQTTSVKMTGTFKTFQPTEMAMPMTTWAKRPNLVRQEAEVTPPAGQGQAPSAPAKPMKMVRAADGTTVWMQQGAGTPQALPAAQATQMMQDSEFDSVFVDYRTKGVTIELVGPEKLAGKDAVHLKVQRKNGPVQHYYLDAQTALEVKVTSEVTQGGTTASVDTELSDYRTVEGRVVPFKTRQLVNGKVAAEMAIDRVEFNVAMPDSLFKMPGK